VCVGVNRDVEALGDVCDDGTKTTWQ